MEIRICGAEDWERLRGLDRHIGGEELAAALLRGGVYAAEEEGELVGWLRYNLFWDSIPFLNMLFILEPFRGKGLGGKLLGFWEEQMRERRFDTVMTSTASDEYAQHFYQRLGYRVTGGFTHKNDPYELLLEKDL